jgi:dihydrofolate reductase
MISIIVAVSENGVIGVDNKLPWHISEDLRRFKTLTLGNTVIMGRKTYESIGKPLSDRVNIVVSRDKGLTIPGCIVVDSIENAIRKSDKNKDTFIIGGGEIYKNSLNFVDKVYMTRINQEVGGDTMFPKLNENWVETEKEEKDSYSFITYEYERQKV